MNSRVESLANNRSKTPLSAIWGGSCHKQLAVGCSLFLAGLAALAIDVPLSHAMIRQNALRPVHRFLDSIEPFGQPYVVLLVAVALFLCDVRRRSVFWRLLTASIGAGLAADIVKLCIARIRPHHYDFQGTALHTFMGLFPGLGRGAGWQSCPSGHVAVAAGLCLALSTIYPRGRWLFAAVASLVALQRIEAGAHYLSDTLWGAAVAYFICMLVFRHRLLGSWFDKREHWSGARPASQLQPESATSRLMLVGPDKSDVFGTLADNSSNQLPINESEQAESADLPILRISFPGERPAPVRLSFVIPLSKACGSVRQWHRQLELVLASLNGRFEIIYVDDGSIADAAQELSLIAGNDSRVQIVSISRAFGRSLALSAGIGRATGGTIVVVETEIQAAPPKLLALLAQLNPGANRVSRAA